MPSAPLHVPLLSDSDAVVDAVGYMLLDEAETSVCKQREAGITVLTSFYYGLYVNPNHSLSQGPPPARVSRQNAR